MVATLTKEKTTADMTRICGVIREIDSCQAEMADHKEALKTLRERIEQLRGQLSSMADEQKLLFDDAQA